MKKIIKTVLATSALVFMVGCFGEDEEAAKSSKVEAGKWRMTSTTTSVTEKSTVTAFGETETTDTSYTDTEDYTDTTDLLLVTDDSLKHYYNDGDTTFYSAYANDFEAEMNKMVEELKAEMKEAEEEGATVNIEKAEATNFSTSVSGNTLTVAYTINLKASMDMMGLMSMNIDMSSDITEKYEAYQGDIPPASWPQTIVEETL